MSEFSPPTGGALSRLRAQLAGPRGRLRIDALLESEDPQSAVAALSVNELYELVTEVGLDDASSIVHLATPAQIQGCFDLEVWDKDHPNMELARPWLATLMEAGFEKVGEVWAGLDPEWRALYIKRYTELFDLTDEDNFDIDDSDGAPIYFTPDRTFAVKLLGDEDTNRLVMALLDELYRADLHLARHTLMAASSEPTAHLEEMSYRWRSARLADLGYVDFYDALDLFQPLEPEAVTIGENTHDRFAVIEDEPTAANLPIAVAEQVLSRSFLARAWGRIGDLGEEERLETALMLLVNKVLAAARARPGDHETVRASAGYATATVSLGLEVLSRGDLDRATSALRTVSMTRLHRVGYTVSLKLARLARGLAPRAATADERETSTLAALLAARPWFPRLLDEPPRPGVRPFESQADVRAVAELLARLTLRIVVAESLGLHLVGMNQIPEPRPALDDHARTAIVRVLAGGAAQPAAVTEDELRAAAQTLERGALPPSARARAQSALMGRLDPGQLQAGGGHLLALIDGWLADVQAVLASIGSERIDPRFVDGILVTTGHGRTQS